MAAGDSTEQSNHARDPDAQLMLRVRADDAEAFEILVQRYQERIVSLMEYLVGVRDQAEDLTQEVFLRVFRARKSYRPTARFHTWLFAIANNVAKNALRSLSRRREVNLVSQATDESAAIGLDVLAVSSSGLAPTRRLDTMEQAEIVRLAVQTLSERQRMALWLSKFEGMSYCDISQTMGVSPPAVKSLLLRARCNLRDILAPYVDEGTLPVT